MKIKFVKNYFLKNAAIHFQHLLGGADSNCLFLTVVCRH